MILSNERAEKLSAYLTADIERAKTLINLSPEEAVAKINADGFDFSVDEIMEFGEQLQKVAASQSEDGELSEEALSEVAGGVVIAAGVLAAGVALFTAGVTFGYKVARDRGW